MNEAFIIDGGVNYDVLAWPMPLDSRRRVLARVMSYEYLWHAIREVGGAYGTGMLCADGIEFLYTYRDPHLRESYETFAGAPAALAARDYTARDLDEFIVGTAAKLDTPRKARAGCPGTGSPVLLRHHGRDARRRPQGAVQRGRRPAQSTGRRPV